MIPTSEIAGQPREPVGGPKRIDPNTVCVGVAPKPDEPGDGQDFVHDRGPDAVQKVQSLRTQDWRIATDNLLRIAGNKVAIVSILTQAAGEAVIPSFTTALPRLATCFGPTNGLGAALHLASPS